MNDATAPTKDATDLVDDAVDLIKGVTDLMRDAPSLTKDATDLIKNVTDLTHFVTDLIKDATDLVEDVTSLIRDATFSIRDATDLTKNVTHLTEDATDLIRDATFLIKDAAQKGRVSAKIGVFATKTTIFHAEATHFQTEATPAHAARNPVNPENPANPVLKIPGVWCRSAILSPGGGAVLGQEDQVWQDSMDSVKPPKHAPPSGAHDRRRAGFGGAGAPHTLLGEWTEPLMMRERQRRAPYQPWAPPKEPRTRCAKGLKARPIPHHRSANGSGFQPSRSSLPDSWGVAPGWYGSGPSALHECRNTFCIRLHPRASETRAERAFHHPINASGVAGWSKGTCMDGVRRGICSTGIAQRRFPLSQKYQ